MYRDSKASSASWVRNKLYCNIMDVLQEVADLVEADSITIQ